MNVSTIDELEVEIRRLQQRIDEVRANGFAESNIRENGEWIRVEDSTRYKYGNRQTGALKRAALDLKNVLTKVNQG